jgi:hypothetical protein
VKSPELEVSTSHTNTSHSLVAWQLGHSCLPSKFIPMMMKHRPKTKEVSVHETRKTIHIVTGSEIYINQTDKVPILGLYTSSTKWKIGLTKSQFFGFYTSRTGDSRAPTSASYAVTSSCLRLPSSCGWSPVRYLKPEPPKNSIINALDCTLPEPPSPYHKTTVRHPQRLADW